MNWKYIGYGVALVIFLVIVGGVGYKIVAPTSKTIVSQGGKLITVNTEAPTLPLGGCSIYRLNMKIYWQKQFNTQGVKK